MGSSWVGLRDAVETAGVLVGNYFYPGSAAVTSRIASTGSQEQLGSQLGVAAQIGTGIAGGAEGNMSNYGSTYDALTGAASTGADGVAGAAASTGADGVAVAPEAGATAGAGPGGGGAVAGGGGAAAGDAGSFESGFTTSGVQPGAATLGASASGGSTLGNLVGYAKTALPIVSAATQLMSASAALSAAKAQTAAPGAATVSMPSIPQTSTSADISSILNKNSLLFGADSPSSTDLTGGNAGTANLGRVTLLGGSNKLGAR